MSFTLTELKNHLRIDGTSENSELQIYLDAAIEYVEDETGRYLSRAPRVAYFDELGDMELIGDSPDSITVTYVDVDSNSQTLNSSIYSLKTHKARAYLTLAYGQDYPSTQDIDAAVSVAYTSGYTTSTLPSRLKSAVLLVAGELYEFREGRLAIQTYSNKAVDALIYGYRIKSL